MTPEPLLLPWLLAVLALLLFVAALMLLRRGNANPMRDRVRMATGIDSRPVIEVGRTIRIITRDERRMGQVIAEAFGYNPELPPAYAASILTLVAVGASIGLVLFWRVTAISGPIAGLIAALLAASAAVRFLLRRKSTAYQTLLFRQIPDTLSLILRAVRAGLPVAEAVRNVSREVPSPTSEEFTRVAGETALGVPLEAAIWHLFDRTQMREYAFFAVIIGLQGQTGGNLSETLENLADLVRRRVAMVAKARALAAEARTSAAVLTSLPFVVGLVLFLINPEYVGELFIDPRGHTFLIAFAVLLSMGLLTIRWMINRSLQD
jgi:tight adherence protein B